MAWARPSFGRWNFTDAEREVALLLLKGLSTKEVAAVRATSERTIRAQAAALYAKAGLTGRAALSAFFLEDLLAPIGSRSRRDTPPLAQPLKLGGAPIGFALAGATLGLPLERPKRHPPNQHISGEKNWALHGGYPARSIRNGSAGVRCGGRDRPLPVRRGRLFV